MIATRAPHNARTATIRAVPPTATHTQGDVAVFPQLVNEVEKDLARRIEAISGPASLREAIAYSVLGGGKRLRPVLTLLSCEAVGGRRNDAMASAAALELVHCFSLVHDDLPAMDDDEMRRGRPTLHIHAGEAMAILAGDVLLSLAFGWIADAALDGETTSRQVSLLAEAATSMINGQVYDTLGGFPSEASPPRQLELVHMNKTAALIRAACVMGGVCGGAKQEAQDELADYGEAVGIMFQIVDDLLDVTQTPEHIGKATGKDLSAGKLTYHGVHGTDASRREIERLQAEAHRALAPLGETAAPLLELCDYMAVRTR